MKDNITKMWLRPISIFIWRLKQKWLPKLTLSCRAEHFPYFFFSRGKVLNLPFTGLKKVLKVIKFAVKKCADTLRHNYEEQTTSEVELVYNDALKG